MNDYNYNVLVCKNIPFSFKHNSMIKYDSVIATFVILLIMKVQTH